MLHARAMSLIDIVAQNLFAARSRRKLSQRAVAEKSNLSVSYISMLERGARTPALETLEVLAKASRQGAPGRNARSARHDKP